MSASLPFSEDWIAESAAKFTASIIPARPRWEYCFSRSSYRVARNGELVKVLNLRTIPVCARLLAVSKWRAENSLGKILRMGFDGAVASAGEYQAKIREKHPEFTLTDMFAVGPLQAWHVGHVYFARVTSHPHVLKVGFSRRVRQRLDDIESKSRARILVRPDGLHVGTLADEHWWHNNWRSLRISGEWFFDPKMPDRTLPHFLAANSEKEAA